jgi:hypothetical protein
MPIRPNQELERWSPARREAVDFETARTETPLRFGAKKRRV